MAENSPLPTKEEWIALLKQNLRLAKRVDALEARGGSPTWTLFLFTELERVTTRMHQRGGVVIVAKDRAHAEAVAAANPGGADLSSDWHEPIVLDWSRLTADWPVVADGPGIYLFPNAGCC